MPLVDMPLDQLRAYQGVTPRPADFDEYWMRAQADLDAVDPQPELVPASFQAPGAACFDLWFTGTRGARLHAKFLRPARFDAPCPAVLQFHGYSVNSGPWSDKLGHVLAGRIVAALDVRGQAGSLSIDVGGHDGKTQGGQITRGMTLTGDPQRLFYRDVFLDTLQLARVVMAMPEVDATRVAATGASQGGGLALACGALEPRIRRIASLFPFLCDYRRVWDLDLAKFVTIDLQAWFKDNDPLHQHEDEFWKRLGYIDVQHLAPRIRGELLMGTGLIDVICPPSTQFAAYNKVQSPRQMAIYPDFGHEKIPDFEDRSFEFLSTL